MAQRALPVVRTADDLQWLPDDGNRYEIIDGVLYVTLAPTLNHQRMVGALYRCLYQYVAALGLELFMAPVDVRASPVTQVEPDLLVAPRSVTHTVQTRWLPMPALVLAIEVLSPLRKLCTGVQRVCSWENSCRCDRGFRGDVA